MKISYRGVYNKTDLKSIQKSILSSHAQSAHEYLKDGKRLAVVTYAKDDGSYTEMIAHHLGPDVDIIEHTTQSPSWETYDVIYLLGGDHVRLKNALVANSFTISGLKNNVHLIGDSAGAMVLSAYFYVREDDGRITYYEGLYPESTCICIVHANNAHYSPEKLKENVREFAKDRKLRIIMLEENQELTSDTSIAD